LEAFGPINVEVFRMVSKKKSVGAGLGAKAAKGASKVALKGGKAQARLVGRAVSPGEPASARFLKYGFFALAGFTVGAILSRLGRRGASSSLNDSETWGSDMPTGSPSDPARPQRPEDSNRTGPEREYSDPSSGPLIGRSHHAAAVQEMPEQQEEVENRIRTRIGEDPRTMRMPRLNVEVNDSVAELRGEAPSEEAKEAAGEIAGNIEGVSEVRNLITVNPNARTRGDKAAGGDQTPPRDR
jgi:hypothetical protein